MDSTPSNKKRLTRMGKISVTVLILFMMTLSYFIIDGVKEQNVSAKKSIEVPIVTNQEVKPKVKEIHQSVNEDIKGNSSKEDESEQIDADKPLDEKQSTEQVTEEQAENGEDGTKEEATNEENGEKDTPLTNENNQIPLKIGKTVYLTFDDGPHAAASMGILDLLKKYNAKATFFMLEPNMERNKDAVKRMVEEGHTVGVHGVTHDVKKVYKSPTSFVEEMNKGIDCIENLTSVKTHLVRAPYGSSPYITPPFKQAADQENFILWDWNIDSDDWKYKKGEYVQKVIQQTNQLVDKKPLIVLMHEKPTTLDYLEQLLTYYQDNGYTMEALNESMEPLQF